MADPSIAAEVAPLPGKARQAAQALQRQGFRVLHIGPTISVEAPETRWRATFGCGFESVTRRVSAETGRTATFRRPTGDAVAIPEALRALIGSVAFVEPPELFHGPAPSG